jgi:mono/diheme cytochrome c family protein
MTKSLKRFGLVALAVPALLALTAISTLAETSPSPSGSPGAAALPGDPTRGELLYAQSGCGSCHGSSLTGGIGPALNPIEKMAGVPNSLDPTFLIDIITNGRTPQPGDPRQTPMPPKGNVPALTPQDIKDLASYIIAANRTGSPPLPPGELAKSTIIWVLIGIGGMTFITILLSQYNMRWIARRAAQRNK